MDIKEFVAQFDNHPILFIGSGISKRYCAAYPNWEDLLKKISNILYPGQDSGYLLLSYETKANFLKIAQSLKEKLDEQIKMDCTGELAELKCKFLESLRTNSPASPLHIYIADCFSKYSLQENKDSELQSLRKAMKNVCSIITTNYDLFIEQEFKFHPLVGNDIILSNPFGSVYKIHGCCNHPESIIATQEDYDHFDSEYELIRSELVSMFIHHPIVFLGYSFQDENIKKIVETIFKYVDPNSPLAEKIRNNFLIVEYKEAIQTCNVEDFVVQCNSSNVRINKVTTDNFSAIYNEIANLKLKASVSDIRKIQQIMDQILNGDKAVVIERGLDDVGAYEEQTVQIGFTTKYMAVSERDFKQKYFEFVEGNAAVQMVAQIDNIVIPKNNYFPIFGYLTINTELSTKTTKIEQQLDKIRLLKQNLITGGIFHTSVFDIYEDSQITRSSKEKSVLFNALAGNITLNDVKEHLCGMQKNLTDYNKLLVVYDYLRYCPAEMRI